MHGTGNGLVGPIPLPARNRAAGLRLISEASERVARFAVNFVGHACHIGRP